MELEFSTDDVANIYGKRLYIIQGPGDEVVERTVPPATKEEKVAVKPEKTVTIKEEKKPLAQPAPPSGPAITWKIKNNSPKVIFMLGEKEFSDKSLTELLRKIVVASQVPTEDVGFGIVHHKPSPQDFDAMPAQFGFFLDESLNPFKTHTMVHSGKKIWIAKRLALMAKEEAAKGELWKMMKEFMADLRTQ